MRPDTVCIYPHRNRAGKYVLRETIVYRELVPHSLYPWTGHKTRIRLWKPAKLPNGRGRQFNTPADAIKFYEDTTK